MPLHTISGWSLFPAFHPVTASSRFKLAMEGAEAFWICPGQGALTGAVAELEAQVGAPEPVDGDGQLDDLPPARAVVVVQHKGVVGAPARLPGAQADAVLPQKKKSNIKGTTSPPMSHFITQW